jgi:putative redox protein
VCSSHEREARSARQLRPKLLLPECNEWNGNVFIQAEEEKRPMEVRVKQIEGVKFSIESRSHVILCDQPVNNGGEDAGMTPPELMLGSLGSCAAFYAVQYLKTRALATSGVEVSVTADKLATPARLGNFHIEVTCPVSLTEDQTTGLMRSVHGCLIHNTLLSPPKVEIELISAAETVEMNAR